MQRISLLIAVLALVVLPANAQAATGHSAVITWGAPVDVISGETYNVYRAPLACSVAVTGPAVIPGPGWTKLNTAPITATTFTDATITTGSWCYYITAVQISVESAPSSPIGGTARPNTVTITTIVIN
jgi:hypothetical protein